MRRANTTAKVRKAPRTRQTVVAGVPDHLGVKREIRLALFEKAIDRLLSQRENCDFVVFELRGSPEAYVQYMLHDGALLGEVSSKGRVLESDSLDKERITALGCIGFEGGGSCSTFARDDLPQQPRRLACLTELLFGAVYRPDVNFDVTVLTRSLLEAQAAQRRSLAMEA
jgi:hypothetical protein